MDYEDFAKPVYSLLAGEFLDSTRDKVRELDSFGDRACGEGERLENCLWCLESTVIYLANSLSVYECIHTASVVSHRTFSLDEIRAAIDDLVRIQDEGARAYFKQNQEQAEANRRDDYSEFSEKQCELYKVWPDYSDLEIDDDVKSSIREQKERDQQLLCASEEEGTRLMQDEYSEKSLLKSAFSNGHPREKLDLSNTLLLQTQYEALLNLMDMYLSYKEIFEFFDSENVVSKEQAFRLLASSYSRVVGMYIFSEIGEHSFEEKDDLLQRKLRSQAKGRKAHSKLSTFKVFAVTVANNSWDQELSDGDAITTIKGMTDYILSLYIGDPSEFSAADIPAETTVRRWITPSAPPAARKSGRPRKLTSDN